MARKVAHGYSRSGSVARVWASHWFDLDVFSTLKRLQTRGHRLGTAAPSREHALSFCRAVGVVQQPLTLLDFPRNLRLYEGN